MTSTNQWDNPKQQKIKFLFQEARIPLWERGNWPIITYNGTIVWARRFGAAAEFAAGPATRVVLRVEVSSESCESIEQVVTSNRVGAACSPEPCREKA